MEHPVHIWQVLKMSSIKVYLHFLDPVMPEGRDRKELASFIRERMVEEYEKLTGADERERVGNRHACSLQNVRTEGG